MPLLKEQSVEDLAFLDAQLQMADLSQLTVAGSPSWDDLRGWRHVSAADIIRQRKQEMLFNDIAGLEKSKQLPLIKTWETDKKASAQEAFVGRIGDTLTNNAAYRHPAVIQKPGKGYMLAEPLYNNEPLEAHERATLIANVLNDDPMLLPHMLYDGHVGLGEAQAALADEQLSSYIKIKLLARIEGLFDFEQREQLFENLNLGEQAQILADTPELVRGFNLEGIVGRKLDDVLATITTPKERLTLLSKYNFAYGNTFAFAERRQQAINDFVAELQGTIGDELATIEASTNSYMELKEFIEQASFTTGLTRFDACSVLTGLTGELKGRLRYYVATVAKHATTELSTGPELVEYCETAIGDNTEWEEDDAWEMEALVKQISKSGQVSSADLKKYAPNIQNYADFVFKQFSGPMPDDESLQTDRMITLLRIWGGIPDTEEGKAIYDAINAGALREVVEGVLGNYSLDTEVVSSLTTDQLIEFVRRCDNRVMRGYLLYGASSARDDKAEPAYTYAEENGLGFIDSAAMLRVMDVAEHASEGAGVMFRASLTDINEQQVLLIDYLVHTYGREAAIEVCKAADIIDVGVEEFKKYSPHYIKLLANAIKEGGSHGLVSFLRTAYWAKYDLTEQEAATILQLNSRYLEQECATHQERIALTKGSTPEQEKGKSGAKLLILHRQQYDMVTRYNKKMQDWFAAALNDIPEAEIESLRGRYMQLKGLDPRSISWARALSPRQITTFKHYVARLEVAAEGDLVVGTHLPIDEILASDDIEATLRAIEQSASALASDTPLSEQYSVMAAEILAKENVFNGPEGYGFVSECSVTLPNGDRKMLGEISKDECAQAAAVILDGAINIPTVERAAAMRRNMEYAEIVAAEGSVYAIPGHAFTHATNNVTEIIHSANLAGECLGVVHSMQADSYPGFVDMLEVPDSLADVTVPEYLGRGTFDGAWKIVYYPGSVADTHSPGEYYQSELFVHQLAFAAVPNTKIACLIDTGEAEGALESVKQAQVETGLYIPIVNRMGELVYSPQEFEDELRRVKRYHTLEDMVTSDTIYPQELWEMDDPGGVTSIAGHMNQVAKLIGDITNTHDFDPESALLVQVAGKLHDIGKAEEGAQEFTNVVAATDAIKQVFDITNEQARKILLLIKHDELLGEILKAIDLESEAVKHGAMPRYARQKLDQFNKVFASGDMKRMALCLYQADVRSKDPALWNEWQVEEKLRYLDLPVYV